MSDRYIPKVGEKIYAYERPEQCEVLCVGKNKVFVQEGKDKEFAVVFDRCKAIPTKADVEREQLNKIINDNVSWVDVVNEIQKAGFMIPKKVKRSEILEVAKVDLFSEEAESFTDVICQLLGDLVENEA